MSTIGRNDPCLCGSGKKYKKCCGDSASTFNALDLRYDHIRRLDAESGTLILRFAQQRYGDDVLEQAWEDFFFKDEIPFDLSHPDADYFQRWFTFDWRPEDEERLAELFLAERKSRLGGDLLRLIEATLHSAFSFYQVLETNPGAGLVLRDVLRKHEIRVTEKSASSILNRGHIIYARVVDLDKTSFIMGCGSYVIPPTYLTRLLEVRTSLENEQLTSEDSVAIETLLDFENELRDTYFLMADDLEHRKLDIRNTDGDPLSLHTLTYGIRSFDEAFQSLKDLEQKATGRPDSELLATAERNAAGEPIRVFINWLKPRKNDNAEGATSLASLMITPSTLVVEVNSEKRSKLIQKEIRKRLGDEAVLLRTEIKSREGIMKEVAERKKDPRDDEESENERLLNESPEVRALMKRLMDQHWATWPDIPVPALRGMTPRQASKDPLGRELLESLLMEFELQDRRQKDENSRVDIAKLRHELGLEAN